MKIDQSSSVTTPAIVRETRSSGTKKTAAGSDEVQLSSLSAQLSASDAEPAFDAARVAEIKQAIADGRFSINAEAIADRLIASAKELVGRHPQA